MKQLDVVDRMLAAVLDGDTMIDVEVEHYELPAAAGTESTLST